MLLHQEQGLSESQDFLAKALLLRTKMMAQIQESKWKTVQLTTDYKGTDYTASLTLGNPDLLSGTGMGVAHYLQKVTKNLSLGAELAYQAAPQIPGL